MEEPNSKLTPLPERASLGSGIKSPVDDHTRIFGVSIRKTAEAGLKHYNDSMTNLINKQEPLTESQLRRFHQETKKVILQAFQGTYDQAELKAVVSIEIRELISKAERQLTADIDSHWVLNKTKYDNGIEDLLKWIKKCTDNADAYHERKLEKFASRFEDNLNEELLGSKHQRFKTKAVQKYFEKPVSDCPAYWLYELDERLDERYKELFETFCPARAEPSSTGCKFEQSPPPPPPERRTRYPQIFHNDDFGSHYPQQSEEEEEVVVVQISSVPCENGQVSQEGSRDCSQVGDGCGPALETSEEPAVCRPSEGEKSPAIYQEIGKNSAVCSPTLDPVIDPKGQPPIPQVIIPLEDRTYDKDYNFEAAIQKRLQKESEAQSNKALPEAQNLMQVISRRGSGSSLQSQHSSNSMSSVNLGVFIDEGSIQVGRLSTTQTVVRTLIREHFPINLTFNLRNCPTTINRPFNLHQLLKSDPTSRPEIVISNQCISMTTEKIMKMILTRVIGKALTRSGSEHIGVVVITTPFILTSREKERLKSVFQGCGLPNTRIFSSLISTALIHCKTTAHFSESPRAAKSVLIINSYDKYFSLGVTEIRGCSILNKVYHGSSNMREAQAPSFLESYAKLRQNSSAPESDLAEVLKVFERAWKRLQKELSHPSEISEVVLYNINSTSALYTLLKDTLKHYISHLEGRIFQLPHSEPLLGVCLFASKEDLKQLVIIPPTLTVQDSHRSNVTLLLNGEVAKVTERGKVKKDGYVFMKFVSTPKGENTLVLQEQFYKDHPTFGICGYLVKVEKPSTEPERVNEITVHCRQDDDGICFLNLTFDRAIDSCTFSRNDNKLLTSAVQSSKSDSSGPSSKERKMKKFPKAIKRVKAAVGASLRLPNAESKLRPRLHHMQNHASENV